MIVKGKIEYGNHCHREVAHISRTNIPVWLVVRAHMLGLCTEDTYKSIVGWHPRNNGGGVILRENILEALGYYRRHQNEIETDLWYEVFQYCEPKEKQ